MYNRKVGYQQRKSDWQPYSKEDCSDGQLPCRARGVDREIWGDLRAWPVWGFLVSQQRTRGMDVNINGGGEANLYLDTERTFPFGDTFGETLFFFFFFSLINAVNSPPSVFPQSPRLIFVFVFVFFLPGMWECVELARVSRRRCRWTEPLSSSPPSAKPPFLRLCISPAKRFSAEKRN